jgi:hypothetical protein
MTLRGGRGHQNPTWSDAVATRSPPGAHDDKGNRRNRQIRLLLVIDLSGTLAGTAFERLFPEKNRKSIPEG